MARVWGCGGRVERWKVVFFFQAEDGIRGLVRSRGLGDVYKRQSLKIKRRRAGGLFMTGIPLRCAAAALVLVVPALSLSLIHI